MIAALAIVGRDVRPSPYVVPSFYSLNRKSLTGFIALELPNLRENVQPISPTRRHQVPLHSTHLARLLWRKAYVMDQFYLKTLETTRILTTETT